MFTAESKPYKLNPRIKKVEERSTKFAKPFLTSMYPENTNLIDTEVPLFKECCPNPTASNTVKHNESFTSTPSIGTSPEGETRNEGGEITDTRNSAAPIMDQFNSQMLQNFEQFLHSPTSFKGQDSSLVFEEKGLENSSLNHMSDDNIASEITPNRSTSDESESLSNLGHEMIHFIKKAGIFDCQKQNSSTSYASFEVAYNEENMMLKHFFKKLLPLLDGHPLSPWPDLALKYCDFDVARSCFISLACIHIYESKKGGNEYYATGIAHINNTMRQLIRLILSNDKQEAINENSEEMNNRHIQSFVILILINVHILFAVLETGRSTLIRFLLKAFGSICQDKTFYEAMEHSENKISLVVVLSWYDTVSAIVSPDCRLPLCNPEWYGTKNHEISTLQMMGCPGEVFKAMAQVCVLRHDLHNGVLEDNEDFNREVDALKLQLFRYRDYVSLANTETYTLRLKGAQCWVLAVYISLLRIFRTPERQRIIQSAVNEFIDVYSSMPHDSPTVTQMVWPVYAIGCECISDFERNLLHRFMSTLYESAQMGTLYSLRWIVEQVWKQAKPQEEILKQWLPKGTDYLPL